MTRYETDRYRLTEDRFGHFTLTRIADSASAYFQGDDAGLWDSNMTSLEVIEESGKWAAGNSLARAFNFLCSGYDEVISVRP